MSGFETGVSVMPLIDGGQEDQGYNPRSGKAPKGRVTNTRKLLLTAAAIMSVMLITRSTEAHRRRKRAEIVQHFRVGGPFLFLHINLLDKRSEFSAPLDVKVWKEDDDYVAEIYGAVAIANTIAFVSEAIDPISIFISLTRRGLMTQAVRYLLFGEGETGLMVYAILLR